MFTRTWQVESLTTFSTAHNVRDAGDVATLMQSVYSSIDVTIFNQEDIAKTFELIPGELNTFRGATKFHEIYVNTQGIIRAKELPTDDSYKLVNITFKRVRVGGWTVGRREIEPVVRQDIIEE